MIEIIEDPEGLLIGLVCMIIDRVWLLYLSIILWFTYSYAMTSNQPSN